MSGLPDPPVPSTAYGGTARHFQRVPTAALVREMQARWQEIDEDEAIDFARTRGDYSVYTFLVALHERGDRSVLEAADAMIASPDPIAQVQGLRVLRELGPPADRPTFPEIWDIVEPLATEETDVGVLAWSLRVLAGTGQPRALPILMRFAGHPDASIRSCVADGLLGCAATLEDPELIATLLDLCDDPDAEVRWDALWEAMEHLDRSRPDVRAAVQRRTTDPDQAVRDLALGS